MAFTLVELIVAISVLALLMAIILTITNSVTKTVRWNNAKLESFASARTAFDLISSKLATATLNTYWEYDNPLNPTKYLRQSDLHFIIRQNQQAAGYGQEIYFQSPESFSDDPSIRSTQGLLNSCSFFVQYCNNQSLMPVALQSGATSSWRYRLMQGNESTNKFLVYADTYVANQDKGSASITPTDWIEAINNGGTAEIKQPYVTPIADNVIALIFWPRLSVGQDPDGTSLTADYSYDSRKNVFSNPQPLQANQLPPTIQVTIVTISEASAKRLDTKSSTPPAIIENALRNKFTNVAQFGSDINDLEKNLNDNHIEYQIYNTSITMRESKWSEGQ
jgi:uncharacterized protein (TIGR02599 family)